jgi:signal transduction histidine kinase
MEALGTLAGGTAHEFNNLLVPMIGLTEMVLEDLPDGHGARRNLESVLMAGERARELVNRILTFSREQPREIVENDFGAIVRNSLDLVRATVPSTIEVDVTLAGEAMPVLIDATEAHQIVMNLASNASHAIGGVTGRIGIRLAVEDIAADAATEIADLPAGRYARFAVEDTGCGMDAATLERIYEPFFTTKDVGQGTGLGFAMIHTIVTRAEGAVHVRSEPGVGTTVDILLPIHQPSSAARAPESA